MEKDFNEYAFYAYICKKHFELYLRLVELEKENTRLLFELKKISENSADCIRCSASYFADKAIQDGPKE